ncbi:hypothetical protein NXY00_16660 [Bacteroides sp. BFG-551]|nr:hypothetical protein [Bacteroides sp. BFG-551]
MKKYGIIGVVLAGVAVICAFTFGGHNKVDRLLMDFPPEADPVAVGNKISDRFPGTVAFAVWQSVAGERTAYTSHLPGCMYLARRTLVCAVYT